MKKILDTLAVRVTFARELKGYTQDFVANKIGMTQQGYGDIESGKSKAPRQLQRISDVLGVTPEWLQYGRGHGPVLPKEMQDIHKSIPPHKVPLIDWEDVQQWVIDSAEPLIKQDWSFIDFVKENPKVYALPIKNDAMVGHPKSFMPGEIIIVDPEKNPENGQYVVVTQGKSSKPIFRQWVTEGDKTILKPLNPQYTIENFTLQDRVCGVMIDRKEGLTP